MRRKKGKRHQESDVLKLTLYPADKSLVQPIPLGPLDFETIHTEKRFTVMFIPEYIVWALTKVSLSSGMIHELPDFIKGGILSLEGQYPMGFVIHSSMKTGTSGFGPICARNPVGQ